MNTIRRVAVTGCVAGVAVVGVGTAATQGDPAPITISPAQVQQLCGQRVPKLGGTIKAGPAPEGGACLTITLRVA